ncbi:tRNA dihydrouridine synthase DusB [Thiomicrospira microaerophila]|uniref:tRNA dihydrouridine synthase DusB n=1 Tax=Thiomicrospira microaerophila TaxID=406020 RepID=UPI000AE10FCE|nr:tRNA dihydrouridine synthase DusB [Thiomicrospira microaerophila]
MKQLKIGRYTLDNNLVLAPMAGITDSVFRRLCAKLGAGYTVGEMLSAQTQLWDSQKSQTRFVNQADPEPRSVQLLGVEPEQLVKAAVLQVEQGAQIIDLNLGCPAKKVCNIAAGSALLAYPDRVTKIFDALVTSLDVPVTVKIRTGTDAEHINAIEIAKIAEQSGISAISIHGRTRADKFNGLAEYDTIKHVKQAVTIPVIANGDISTPEQAQFVLKYTQADGIMIGRAALGNPWIFQQVRYYLETGTHLEKPCFNHIKAILLEHLDGLYALYGELQGLRIARKHTGWYCQHLNEGEKLRRAFNQLDNPAAQQALIEHFFANLV